MTSGLNMSLTVTYGSSSSSSEIDSSKFLMFARFISKNRMSFCISVLLILVLLNWEDFIKGVPMLLHSLAKRQPSLIEWSAVWHEHFQQMIFWEVLVCKLSLFNDWCLSFLIISRDRSSKNLLWSSALIPPLLLSCFEAIFESKRGILVFLALTEHVSSILSFRSSSK